MSSRLDIIESSLNKSGTPRFTQSSHIEIEYLIKSFSKINLGNKSMTPKAS